MDSTPWITVPFVDWLGLPSAPTVGSYGGGSEMCMSRRLVHIPTPTAVSMAASAPAPPASAAAAGSPMPTLPTSAHVLLSSHVYGADHRAWNVFPHGAVLGSSLSSPAAGQAFPSVGLTHTVGLATSPDPDDEPLRWAGIGHLEHAADVHAHTVDGELGQGVRLGSDMAKLRMVPESADGWAGAWIWVWDVPTALMDLTVWIAVPPQAEQAVDAALDAAVAAGAVAGLGLLVEALRGVAPDAIVDDVLIPAVGGV